MAWPVLPNGWEAWQIEEMIGEGSYGAVYKAARKIGEDTVYSAIKIIHIPGSAQEAKALEKELNSREAAREYCRDLAAKCMKEIRAMDSLKGITNIVSVEDGVMTENEDGFGWTIYIRMELLTCFTDYVTLHTLKEEDVIRMGEDLCTALSCCEKVNIIHRDIKPSNIFVSKLGFFKLGDFGVACRLDRTGGTFSSKGTSSYMAPEVFKCSPYDQRADIYSLGLVLYRQMNRNRDPFVDLDKNIIYAKDREEAMARRLSGEPLPPPADASPGLARVILKACDPDPEKRYRDAASFRTALEQIGKPDMQKTGAISRWLLPGLLALAALIAGLWFFFGGRAGNCQGNPSVTEVPTVTETAALTETPTQKPTPQPTEELTPALTPEPTEEPTATPTAEPTPAPTPEPTAEPTATPTAEPTPTSTPDPTAEPTATPTAEPTPEITAVTGTPKTGISGIVSGIISDLLKRLPLPLSVLIPNASAAPDDTQSPAPVPDSAPTEIPDSKAAAETAIPTPGMTATPTPTTEPTATPSPTPKVTATPTLTPTATPSLTPKATAMLTSTPNTSVTPTAVTSTKVSPENCTHPNKALVASRKATCVLLGEEVWRCPDCGKEWSFSTPYAGHDLVMTTYQYPCGTVYNCYKCKTLGCDYIQMLDKVSDGNCTWGETNVLEAATTEQEGRGYQTCVYCGRTRLVSIPKLTSCAHTHTATRVITESTCWMTGTEERYCTDCGQTIESWALPAASHLFNGSEEVVKEPTCTERGILQHACQNFDKCHQAEQVEIPALGHDYQKGADGVVRCTRCGDVPQQSEGQHQHVWGNKRLIEYHGEDGDWVYRWDCMYCDAYKTGLSMPPHDDYEDYLIIEIHEP